MKKTTKNIAKKATFYMFAFVLYVLKFFTRNLIDFVSVIAPLPEVKTIHTGKKILIFNWRDTKHAFAGGAEVYIHEIAKRLVTRGNYVTLFCGNDGKSPRNEIV